MFQALPRPSSGAYNCNSSLWFYRWSMVVAAATTMLQLLMQLYAPDDGRGSARNMLSHT